MIRLSDSRCARAALAVILPLVAVSATPRSSFAEPAVTATLQAELVASDAKRFDHFGSDARIEGDVAVVGAIDKNQSAGAAYVFERGGTLWSSPRELVASDATTDAVFGSAIALSGETMFIGAPSAAVGDKPAGAVYVFEHRGSSWLEVQKLVPDDPTHYGGFGVAVAVDHDTAIVASALNDIAGAFQFYVRTGSTWKEVKRVGVDVLGGSVQLRGDTAAVSADNGVRIYVRSGTTWNRAQDIEPPHGTIVQNFGSTIGLSDDTMVVGSPGAVVCGSGDACWQARGDAFVYTRVGSTWLLTQRLSAKNPHPNDTFGGPVAISGDVIAVGASIFLRRGPVWERGPTLVAGDEGLSLASNWSSVSVSGDTVLFGDTVSKNEAGAAFAFELPGVAAEGGAGCAVVAAASPSSQRGSAALTILALALALGRRRAPRERC